MDRKSDSILVCVRIDRCWNRYWRCLLLVGVIIFGVFLFVFLTGGNNNDQVLENDWQKHWSQTQDSAPGSKLVFEPAGNVVNVKEEFVDQYVNREHDPEPDESEYYDRDLPDVVKKDSDYMQQSRNDEMVGKQNLALPGSMGIVPDIRDYSLRSSFQYIFNATSLENIVFEDNYANPCWPEPIPNLPYKNNSYLRVNEQAKLLEPQFQYMRQLFAKRTDPSNHWRLRCLPSFYLMETPPTATPRLYNALRFHPLIVNPEMAEPEFWNQRGPERVATLKDYLDLFDSASEKIRSNTTNLMKDGQTILEHKQITGDGTSSYLWTLENWRRFPANLGESEPKVTHVNLIKQFTPAAKIIMVLRNPTERLFLGYLSQSENPSAADFHSKAGQALASMSECVKKRAIKPCVYDSFLNKRMPVRLRIGIYHPFVYDWINTFGKDQVKVIRYEDYVNSPSEIINEVCSFLGLPPYPTKDLETMEIMVKDLESKRKANQKIKMLSSTRKMLRDFHRNLNQKLADLLNDNKFTWPEITDESDQQRPPAVQTEAQKKEEDEKLKEEEQRQRDADQQERERQERERQDRERQDRERQVREQQDRERQDRERQDRERQEREQQEKARLERDRQLKEQQERDRLLREQQQRDEQQRQQLLREQQLREQQQRAQQNQQQGQQVPPQQGQQVPPQQGQQVPPQQGQQIPQQGQQVPPQQGRQVPQVPPQQGQQVPPQQGQQIPQQGQQIPQQGQQVPQGQPMQQRAP